MQKLWKYGNKKIGSDTLIFNMCSAHDCPSRMLGLCQLENPSKCYALKAEKMYPNVRPYRDRQAKYWDNTDAFNIYVDMGFDISMRSDNTRYMRINESGDFRDNRDINKLNEVAYRLKKSGNVSTYCYSARKDLDFTNIHFVVNGSGFMAHNEYRVVKEYSGKNPVCPNDCRKCDLYKVPRGIVIEQLIH